MKWSWIRTHTANYLVNHSLGVINEAKVEIKAHDKSPTLRRVVNKKTLERLQSYLSPNKKRCPHCDQEIQH